MVCVGECGGVDVLIGERLLLVEELAYTIEVPGGVVLQGVRSRGQEDEHKYTCDP
jgi:hypothetical protein